MSNFGRDPSSQHWLTKAFVWFVFPAQQKLKCGGLGAPRLNRRLRGGEEGGEGWEGIPVVWGHWWNWAYGNRFHEWTPLSGHFIKHCRWLEESIFVFRCLVFQTSKEESLLCFVHRGVKVQKLSSFSGLPGKVNNSQLLVGSRPPANQNSEQHVLLPGETCLPKFLAGKHRHVEFVRVAMDLLTVNSHHLISSGEYLSSPGIMIKTKIPHWKSSM